MTPYLWTIVGALAVFVVIGLVASHRLGKPGRYYEHYDLNK